MPSCAAGCDDLRVNSSTESLELLANWWECWRRFAGSREERKALSRGEPADVQAAHDLVEHRVRVGGPGAVELLVALNNAGPADNDGVTVGAGPLEDLLHEHADSVIDEIEQQARQSPLFARALSYVWLERGHLSKATEDRLAPWVAALTKST
jgi:hypothetical protein